MGKKSSNMFSAGGPSVPRVINMYNSFDQALNALESMFKTVGPDGKSRLETDMSKTLDATLGSNAALRGYYENVLAGVSGDAGSLPADFQENILRDVRGSQAARGVLDSDTSGIQEAVALMGGREQIRAQRLNQANQLLTSGLLPTLDKFMPSSMDLLSAQMGLQQLAVNRGLGKQANYNNRMNSIAGNTNNTISSVGGLLGGMGA